LPQRIAFLGIGLMGAPMARNLLAAGFPLVAWNRTRAKAEALSEAGATVAASAADAATGADVLITMLDSGPVVDQVFFEQGAAAALEPCSLVIDMSSIPPATAKAHATHFAGRSISYLDAPVSGGTVGAREGKLTIMVGGSEQAFARAQPVFAALGRASRVGPTGTGQLAKLCNQAIVGITIGAVAEALLLAAAGGADPAAVREALRGGFADSRILALHGQRMLDRDFVPGAPVRVQVKDLDTILATAADAGLELPLAERVATLYHQLLDNGRGGLDHSALLLELERLNPSARLGTTPDKTS
jgi:2-hydroxy-3-oxopropionate reductase